MSVKRIRCRSAVAAFAREMEMKLREHDHHRTGWTGFSKQWLLERLALEMLELSRAICSGDDAAIRKEAADVGNFAMMIHDNAPAEEET